jgi:hypothetical protein
MNALRTNAHHLHHLVNAIAAAVETPAPTVLLPFLVVALFIASHAE